MRDGSLRVALIGTGGIGCDQHLPGWAGVPFASVVAVADTSQPALERAGSLAPDAVRYLDWREMLRREEIDAVDICTPNRTHTEIALTALETGRHVLCEKPLATTAAEVVLLRDAAERSGKLLMTAQHLRFDETVRRLKTMIDAGDLGDVYHTRAQWLRRRLLPARATFTDRALSGGGPAYDIGVHVLDLAHWFMGCPRPVAVSAALNTHLARRDDLAGEWGDWDRQAIDVEDFAVGFIRFANGATLALETSWLAFQPERETMRVQCYGSRGGLLWPDGVVSGETNRVPWDRRLHETPRNRAHHDAIRAFAAAVRDGAPSPVPVEQTLDVIRILEGCYLASAAGREVRLENEHAAPGSAVLGGAACS
jgi:predicted dehydrogenase